MKRDIYTWDYAKSKVWFIFYFFIIGEWGDLGELKRDWRSALTDPH